MQPTLSTSRSTSGTSDFSDQILSYDQIEFFDREGYLIVPPKKLRTEAEESILLSEVDSIFPSYESGFSPCPIPDPTLATPNTHTFDIGDMALVGLGREFVGDSPFHDTIRKGKENWLYGKRVSISGFYRPKTLAPFAESTGFLRAAKQLLRADELSLHTSGITSVYPGYLGEHGQFHTDTSGYTSDALMASRLGRFVLVSLTYLVDVDLELAPLRVIPKSHKYFLKINEVIARYKGKNPNRNQMTQGGGALYQELLPDYLESPQKVLGPAGTTIFMHSGLLHSATENFSHSKARPTLSVNYSVRQHQEFRKKYRHAPVQCQSYASAFKDPGLTHWTYVKFSGPPSLSERLRTKLGVIKSKLKALPALKVKVPTAHESEIQAGECQVSIDKNSLDIILRTATGTKLVSRTQATSTDDFSAVKKLILVNLFESLGYQDTVAVVRRVNKFFASASQIEFHSADADKILRAYDQRDYCFFEGLPRSTMPIDSWLRFAVRAIMGPAVDLLTDKELYDAYDTKTRTEFLRSVVFRSVNLDSLDSKLVNSTSFYRAAIYQLMSDAGLTVDRDKCDETPDGRLIFKGYIASSGAACESHSSKA